MSYQGANKIGRVPEASQKIASWSFSRYKAYQTCPAKAKYAYIDRLPEEESEQMKEGSRIHSLAEGYLKGDIERVPPELKLLADDYRDLRAYARKTPGAVLVEQGVAFTADLALTDWFSKAAWLRCKYDVLVLNGDGSACVIDLKTGTQRREDKDQLSLFSFAVMLTYDDIEEVSVENWYSKTGAVLPARHSREQFDDLKAHWLNAAAPMLADTQFLPTPNPLCRFCSYRKSNNGPCQYGA